MPKRHALQQEVVDALIESKAVDFEAVSAVLSRHGATLAQKGVDFGVIINWRVMDICIPVDPFQRFDLGRMAGMQDGGG